MDTALITALVAAAVSSAGALVTLWTARQLRKASLAQLALAAALKSEETVSQTLRAYASEIEKLRIESWHLIAAVRGVRAGGDGQKLAAAVNSFEVSGRTFVAAWADARPEIPSPSLEVIRMMRHGLRHRIHEVIEDVSVLASGKGRGDRAKEVVQNVDAHLEALLQGLDQLLGFIVGLRNARLATLLTS